MAAPVRPTNTFVNMNSDPSAPELSFQDFTFDSADKTGPPPDYSRYPDDNVADTAPLLEGQEPETKSGPGFWEFKYYQQFFDINTDQVLHRIFWSMIPLPGRATFLHRCVQPNPDLYGCLPGQPSFVGCLPENLFFEGRSSGKPSFAGRSPEKLFFVRRSLEKPFFTGRSPEKPFFTGRSLEKPFFMGRLPGKPSFVGHSSEKPFFTEQLAGEAVFHDFRGPFWICATLVFSIAIGGNLSDYLNTEGKASQNWRYDFHKVSLAATTIYSYAFLIPLALYAFLWYRRSQANYRLLDLICLYGYSLAIYVPISILCVIQIGWLQLLLVIIGTFLSGSVLILTLWPAVKEDQKKIAWISLVLVLVFHGLMAFGFLEYFFAPVSIKPEVIVTTPLPAVKSAGNSSQILSA